MHELLPYHYLFSFEVGLLSVDEQLVQLLMSDPVFFLTLPRAILRHLAPRALLHLTLRVARDTRTVYREVRWRVLLFVEYDSVFGRAALFEDTRHLV